MSSERVIRFSTGDGCIEHSYLVRPRLCPGPIAGLLFIMAYGLGGHVLSVFDRSARAEPYAINEEVIKLDQAVWPKHRHKDADGSITIGHVSSLR